MDASPALSIVIPTRNDAAALDALLDDLRAQEDLGLQVIVADSGSTDGTLEVARRADVVVHAGRGRGRALNAGRRAATAPTLLFLHADSAFTHRRQLRDALAVLRSARRDGDRVAGHFQLAFVWRGPAPAGAAYYEAKSGLGRVETVNGDQGLLIDADWFDALGGYDESLPFLEDRVMDRAIHRHGRWVLLPGRLRTSGRRFEEEGLAARQAGSALAICMHALGIRAYFEDAQALYRPPGSVGAPPPRSMPFARLWGCVRTLPPRQALARFYAIGGYARLEAWQLAFALDYRRRGAACVADHPLLDRWDRHVTPRLDTVAARVASNVVSWTWFALAWRHYARPAP